MNTANNNNIINVPNAAIQQALVVALGLSYRKAAKLTGVTHRTVWQHVNGCDRGANLTAWHRRAFNQRSLAIHEASKRLVDSIHAC